LSELIFKTTKVFHKNLESNKRIIVNQGGTRSSKTWSIAQLFAYKMLTEKNKVFAIVRKSMPSLRATAMKDFFTILKDLKIYDDRFHNLTNNVYYYNNNEVEFFSIDESQKVRGRKRNYLWINECNEIEEEKFIQLILRTTDKIYLDYNPSIEIDHWIVNNVLKRDDHDFIKSTYKDNPFLEPETVKEIERLQLLDPSYWQIYGLGERSDIQTGSVFNRKYYKEYETLPDDVKGIIYCDPNLAIKSKGDNTAVVHLVYSPKTNYYYLPDAICRSFSDSNELLNVVYNIYREGITKGIGFDGNVTQESTWTNLIRGWARINGRPFLRVDYKRYKVDDLAKNVQMTWNEGRILFPPGFSDKLDNKRFLIQLYSFTSKKENKKDDAPDALICAFEYIHERRLHKKAESVYKQPEINANFYNY